MSMQGAVVSRGDYDVDGGGGIGKTALPGIGLFLRAGGDAWALQRKRGLSCRSVTGR